MLIINLILLVVFLYPNAICFALTEKEQSQHIWELVEKNDLTQALSLSNKLIIDYPQSIKAKSLKAMILLKGKEDYSAMNFAQSIIKSCPNPQTSDEKDGIAASRQVLANVYAHDGKVNLMISQLEEALKLKPDAEIIIWELAVGYAKIGMKEKSKEMADKLIDIGDKGETKGALVQYAKQLLERIGITNSPVDVNNSQAIFDRVEEYLKNNNFEDALKELNNIITTNPSLEDAYLRRGNVYADKGDYEKAIFDYNKALEIDPKSPKAYVNRGLVYANEGRFNEAILDYNKAIDLNPNTESAYNNRGLVFSNEGKFDQAISDFNKAIEIDPKYIGAYINRGDSYNKKGNYEHAILSFNKALEIDPEFSMAYYGRGSVYAKQDNYEQAISDYNKALKLSPDSINFYNGLREALKKKK